MPDQTIETTGIQGPPDHDLQQKSYRSKNRESRKVHAIDIELANHDKLPSCNAGASPDPASATSVCSICLGRYGGASGQRVCRRPTIAARCVAAVQAAASLIAMSIFCNKSSPSCGTRPRAK